MRNLSASQAEEVNAVNMSDMEQRAGFRIRQRYLNPNFGAAAGAAMTLMNTFEPITIKDLFAAAKDPAKLNEVLNRSVDARRDPSKYRQAISEVLAASGNAQDATAKFGLVDMMARTDPLTVGFTSSQAKDNALRLAASNVPGFNIDEARGFTKTGFLDGILNAYGGTDKRTAFARIAATNPGSIAGGIVGMDLPTENDRFTTKQMANLVNQFQKQFSGSEAGRDLLQEMGLQDKTGRLTLANDVDLDKFRDMFLSPRHREMLFRNFQEYKLGGRSAFVSKSQVDSTTEYGGLTDIAKTVFNQNAVTGTRKDLLMELGIALDSPNHPLVQVRGGVPGKILGHLTNEEMQAQAANIIKQTTSLDVLQNLKAGTVHDLARMNHQWGQTAADVINARENMLRESEIDDPKQKADLKRMKDELKSAGIVSHEDAGAMKITGSLKLVGDELQFFQASMKGGKK
jgi:hypothetical protein